MMERSIDLICLGRVAVDLYAEQIHCELRDAQTFRKYVGGCAGNIAIGTSRLGLKTVMLSKVGDDAMGDFVLKTLKQEGVETKFVNKTKDHLTGLVLLGVCPPDHFPLIFYRENCADMQLNIQEMDIPVWSQAKALVLTGTGFSTESMRKVSRIALQKAQMNQVKVILDLDYRPVLWGKTAKGNGESRFEASSQVTHHYQTFLKACDLIVGTEEEFLIATGETCAQAAIEYLLSETNAILVLKQGSKGCTIYPTKEQALVCLGDSINVLNVLGAGDAFMSGFLYGWLNNQSLDQCGQYGNACGAIVVSRHGCAPAMPYQKELAYYLTQSNKINALQQQSMTQLHQSMLHRDRQNTPLCMLAFDHRTQFEKTTDDQALIKHFKNLIWQGFTKILAQQNGSNHHRLGILVDPIYGSDVIANACDIASSDDFEIGLPIEKANKRPLEWIDSQSLYAQILERPTNSFVKVLCHYETDMGGKEKESLAKQLKKLNQVCLDLGRAWMLELITSENVAGIKWAYENKMMPTWWKINAPDSFDQWHQIEALLNQYDKAARVVILGGETDMDSLSNTFQLAKTASKCTGFVVGRSIFWECWLQFLQGTLKQHDIPTVIANRYQSLISIWQKLPQTEHVKKEQAFEEFV